MILLPGIIELLEALDTDPISVQLIWERQAPNDVVRTASTCLRRQDHQLLTSVDVGPEHAHQVPPDSAFDAVGEPADRIVVAGSLIVNRVHAAIPSG